MENFVFQNPTKLIFGKGMISHLNKEIPQGKRVMVTFGGGSVKKNGVYEQVKKALESFEVIEFWGIAIQLGKEKGVDFLLAVGGGSVLDGTKLIAAGLLYEGDAWELVLQGRSASAVPMGTVLTLPATGSEMNSGAVISRKETAEKYPFYSKYPVFYFRSHCYVYFAYTSGSLWYCRYFCACYGAVYDYSRSIPFNGQMGGGNFTYSYRNCPRYYPQTG